jgi:hypothetical protein
MLDLKCIYESSNGRERREHVIDMNYTIAVKGCENAKIEIEGEKQKEGSTADSDLMINSHILALQRSHRSEPAGRGCVHGCGIVHDLGVL